MTDSTDSNIHDSHPDDDTSLPADSADSITGSTPTDSAPDSPQDPRATTWLTPEQVGEMRTACYDRFASYLQARNDALISLTYDTGLRVSELAALDTTMLRDGATMLYVPPGIQKDYPNSNTPSAVTISLKSDTTRAVRSFLADRWKETDSLFPSRKADRITPQGVRYVVGDAAQAADVDPFLLDGSTGSPSDVTPHTLRHSVAYRMLHVEDGNSLYDVRNRLRHSSIQTTERVYDHFQVV